MAVIILPALAATSIRHWGTSETFTLSVGLLLMACAAALFQKQPLRCFWLGFGLFGAFYLAISIVSPWEEHLPTNSLLDQLYQLLSPQPQTRDVDDFGESRRLAQLRKDSFRRAGHSAFALLFGLMGGTLTLLCFPSGRENHPLDPPEGSLLKEGWREEGKPER